MDLITTGSLQLPRSLSLGEPSLLEAFGVCEQASDMAPKTSWSEKNDAFNGSIGRKKSEIKRKELGRMCWAHGDFFMIFIFLLSSPKVQTNGSIFHSSVCSCSRPSLYLIERLFGSNLFFYSLVFSPHFCWSRVPTPGQKMFWICCASDAAAGFFKSGLDWKISGSF